MNVERKIRELENEVRQLQWALGNIREDLKKQSHQTHHQSHKTGLTPLGNPHVCELPEDNW